MIFPRVQLTDAVSISPRSTKQISSALEVSMPQATLWVNSTNIIFLDWYTVLRVPSRERNPVAAKPQAVALCHYIPSKILLNNYMA